jgi:N-methylhydantoinase B
MLAQAVTGMTRAHQLMARCIMHVLDEYPETLEPGDVIITNDPWLTSGHHYDVTVVTPTFRNGHWYFFANMPPLTWRPPVRPDAMDV